ncbi:tail fiber domain-containing protein [Martelella sp. FOR1707]
MGKPKPPTTPDPAETASAQTATNIGTAIANSYLGNVNQVTQDGTLTYDVTGYHDWTNPLDGTTTPIPTWTATQTLSPEQQAIKDQQDAAQLNLAGLANDQSNFLRGYLNEPVDLSTGNVEGYINSHFMDDFNKRWDQNKADLDTQMANQGIDIGSTAYSRAFGDYSQQRSDAYDNLYGNQYQNAIQNILAERNQPINEIGALLGTGQVETPNFMSLGGSQMPTVDYAGLVNQNYQNQMAAYNSAQQSRNSIMGGLFGLGSSAIMAKAGPAAIMMSDERVKKDVHKVGELKGQNVYEFRYKGEPESAPMSMGVMAQEVEQSRPDAVLSGEDGIKHVDYGRLFQLGA